MIASEVKDIKQIPCLFADPEGFKSVVDEFVSMFDREVFDCIVSRGPRGHAIAGILANKFGSGLVCAGMKNKFCKDSLKSGWTVVVICDTLENGEKQLDLIQKIEECGCKVIRVGFISEQTSFGARKSKILRKYPFEAVITL